MHQTQQQDENSKKHTTQAQAQKTYICMTHTNILQQ